MFISANPACLLWALLPEALFSAMVVAGVVAIGVFLYVRVVDYAIAHKKSR